MLNLLKKQNNKNYNIRSFVRRKSRLTKGQKRALLDLWPKLVIDYQIKLLNLNQVFNNLAPVTLDIGFGMGEALITMAKMYPKQNFIGIEVYLPGVGACLANANNSQIKNLRLIVYDAVKVLENMITNHSLAVIQLFFPDPWHKTRHNKRRIIQSSFIALVEKKLISNGILHIVTDWQPYVKHIIIIMSLTNAFIKISSLEENLLRSLNRPITKFEQRGQRLGHKTYDLFFVKK